MILDLKPNWGQQSGSLNHSRHRLQLIFTSDAMVDQLFADLWEFRHFGGDNSLASVYIKEWPLGSGMWYAFFDSKGLFGWFSDWINDSEVPVRIWRQISKKLVVGDTCGKHMLVGQRRWWVEKIGDSIVLVKTESYDYARGLLNRIAVKGLNIIGVRPQIRVWTDYFKNIRQAYGAKGVLSNGAIVDKELQKNEKLSNGIAYLQESLGDLLSPWQLASYPGKEIP